MKTVFCILAIFIVLLLPSCSWNSTEESCPGSSDDPVFNMTSSDSYPVNENGETYGTLAEGTLPLFPIENIEQYERLPDLIAAVSSNGREGYVRKKDLYEGGDAIPVYEQDGTTVIGTFSMNGDQYETTP